MAQDQEKVWTTSSLRSQASRHSLSWSIRDLIGLASYSKWKGDLAKWKGKSWVCSFLIDQRNWRTALQRSSVRPQQDWVLWPSGHDISTTVMHRCCPCHSGWKSWTAGLAYVQTPVLWLFKYILRGICVLKTVNLLCATTVFWSGRKNHLVRSQHSCGLALPWGSLQMALVICEGMNQLPSTHLALALSAPPDAQSLMRGRFSLVL